MSNKPRRHKKSPIDIILERKAARDSELKRKDAAQERFSNLVLAAVTNFTKTEETEDTAIYSSIENIIEEIYKVANRSKEEIRAAVVNIYNVYCTNGTEIDINKVKLTK